MLKILLVAALLTALGASRAAGGTVWHDPSGRGGAQLQVAFPQFEAGDVSAQVISLTGRGRLNEDLVAQVGLPFSTVSSQGERGSVLGNPYVGLELGKEGMVWTIEGGLRLPFVPSSPSGDELAALLAGAVTDFVSRPGAFVVDAVPIEVTFHYRGGDPHRNQTTAHLGLEVWAPVGDRDGSSTFFVYGADFWIDARPLRFNLGADGRLQFDERGDENEIEVVLGLQAEAGRARPGLELRIPADDLQDVLDFTIALYVGIR